MVERLPEAYVRFIELFNAGKFWESHEVLEAPWRLQASPFYKGLIIFASTFVHVQRGNPVGVIKQSSKVPRYLTDYVPHYLGLDVDKLVAHAQRCHALGVAHKHVRGAALAQRIPLYRLEIDPSLLRGDEPELRLLV